MIKFFRRIRQRLLTDNKFSKYLLYAIGEIVLVVLGILIALQINNNNEKRKAEQELQSIYDAIIVEIDSDISKLNRILPVYEYKISAMERIIDGEVSEREWLENDTIRWSFCAFPDFEIGDNRAKLLSQKSATNENSSSLNNKLIDFYSQYRLDIKIRNREVQESWENNLSHWRNTTIWFSQFLRDNDVQGLYEHSKDNPLFRNRVTHHRIMMNRLYKKLKEYKTDLEVIKSEIKAYTNKA